MSLEKLDLKAAIHICENMRARDRACLQAMIGEFSDNTFAIGRWQTNGAAWALYQDGIPVGMAGLAEVNPWTAVAWMVTTDGITVDSWKKVIRFTRKVLRNASSHYRRIDAACIGNWPDAQEYAKAAGFTQCGTRKNAGRDGEDVIEFVILGTSP